MLSTITSTRSVRRRVLTVLSVVFPFVLLAGCAATDEPGDEPNHIEQPATIADPGRPVRVSNGEIIIPTEPEAIAVLWRPTLSALIHLGREPVATVGVPEAPDRGIAAYVPADYDVDSVEVVSSSPSPSDLDLEALREIGPDLIIGTDAEGLVEVDVLAELSSIAPTILLESGQGASWRRHLSRVAEVLRVPSEATTLLQDYDARVAEVRAGIGDPEQLTVSVLTAYGADEIRVEPPTSFAGQIVADLGFAHRERRDRASDEPVSIAPDQLGDVTADVVFVLANTARGQTIDDNVVVNAPAWDELRAAANNGAFVFDYAYWGANNYDAAMRVLTDIESSLASTG